MLFLFPKNLARVFLAAARPNLSQPCRIRAAGRCIRLVFHANKEPRGRRRSRGLAVAIGTSRSPPSRCPRFLLFAGVYFTRSVKAPFSFFSSKQPRFCWSARERARTSLTWDKPARRMARGKKEERSWRPEKRPASTNPPPPPVFRGSLPSVCSSFFCCTVPVPTPTLASRSSCCPRIGDILFKARLLPAVFDGPRAPLAPLRRPCPSLFPPGPGATSSPLSLSRFRHHGRRCWTWTSSASLVLLLVLLLLLHASYSRREAAVRRFDAPTWPNWKKPVSSLRSSFFACILAFCTANTSTLPCSLFLSLAVLFLFSPGLHSPAVLSVSSLLALRAQRRENGRGVGESPRDFMIRRDQIHLRSTPSRPRAASRSIPNSTLPGPPSWLYAFSRSPLGMVSSTDSDYGELFAFASSASFPWSARCRNDLPLDPPPSRSRCVYPLFFQRPDCRPFIRSSLLEVFQLAGAREWRKKEVGVSTRVAMRDDGPDGAILRPQKRDHL